MLFNICWLTFATTKIILIQDDGILCSFVVHFLDKFLKTDYQLDKIAKQLLDWYAQNKRDLPWRNTRNPYKIWLSEIILQQTRVDQGLDYYHKFVQNYPTV